MNISTSLTNFSPQRSNNQLQDARQRVRVINDKSFSDESEKVSPQLVGERQQKVNFSANAKERITSLKAEQSRNLSFSNSLISQYTQTESLSKRENLESLVGVDIFV